MSNIKIMRKVDKLQESSAATNPCYITHGGLRSVATKYHCRGIVTKPVLALCRPEKNLWVFKATVFKSSRCRRFVGYGVAHPGNVSPLIFNNAETRMAEIRAVNRARRKVYSVARCSLEGRPRRPLSPEQLSVLRRTVQYRAPFQKGVLRSAPTNSSRSGRVGSILAGPSQKKSKEMPTCNVYLLYRARRRRGRWGRWRQGEWAGGEGAMARQRRAGGMCNRLHIRKIKGATSEAVLTLIDGVHQDNLPVQPVAQRPAIERSRKHLFPAPPSICFEGPLGASPETSTHQKESA
jgi:hypothetical protein